MISTLNGLPLAALHLQAVPPLDAWRDSPRVDRGSVPIPGAVAHWPSPRAVTARRELRVRARLLCPTVADRAPRMARISDALRGLVEIGRSDAPGRVLRGVYDGCVVLPVNGVATISDLMLELAFSIFDGATYDAQPRVLAIGTTAVEVDLGSLPSAGILLWPGGWSGTRTLDYVGGTGIRYGTLSLTVPGTETFGAGEHVALDLARWTCVRVSATGVRTNAYHWLSGGDWFLLQPHDRTRLGARGPTLRVSAGTAVLRYRRAWRE